MVYKILTFILATTTQKYIKKFINPDQTALISGRHGINNIRRVLNLQSLKAKDTQTSVLLSLDAEKAFDRVDWQFLEGGVYKISLFADNILLFIKHPIITIPRLMQCLTDYGNMDIKLIQINQRQ